MKTQTSLKYFVSLLLLMLVSGVQAVELSQSIIDKYVDSVQLLKSSDNEYVNAIEQQMLNNPDFNFDLDDDGQFAVVRNMIKTLDEKTINAVSDVVVDEAGFASLDEWAATGDKVAGAMAAIQLEKEPVDTSEITPEMMSAMPESMRAQFEGIIRAIEAVKNVPKADIALVQKNYSKLSALMD